MVLESCLSLVNGAARPAVDRVGRFDDVHSRRRKAVEGCLSHVREVEDSRNHDGAGAVLDDVDLLRQSRILCHDLRPKVLHRPRKAMALGLPEGDDHIKPDQAIDKPCVLLGNRLAVLSHHNFRLQNRVVLCQGVATLDLELRGRTADDIVEEHRLLNQGDEGMRHASQHGMVGPDFELIFAGIAQTLGIVLSIRLQIGVVAAAEFVGEGGVDTPFAALDVVERDERGERSVGVVAVLVNPEHRMENLVRHVCVEGRHDLRDDAQIAVDELARPDTVFDCRPTATTTNEQLTPRRRKAERDLVVDDQQTDLDLVCRAMLDVVSLAKGDCILLALQVGDWPHLVSLAPVEETWNRKRLETH